MMYRHQYGNVEDIVIFAKQFHAWHSILHCILGDYCMQKRILDKGSKSHCSCRNTRRITEGIKHKASKKRQKHIADTAGIQWGVEQYHHTKQRYCIPPQDYVVEDEYLKKYDEKNNS